MEVDRSENVLNYLRKIYHAIRWKHFVYSINPFEEGQTRDRMSVLHVLSVSSAFNVTFFSNSKTLAINITSKTTSSSNGYFVFFIILIVKYATLFNILFDIKFCSSKFCFSNFLHLFSFYWISDFKINYFCHRFVHRQ